MAKRRTTSVSSDGDTPGPGTDQLQAFPEKGYGTPTLKPRTPKTPRKPFLPKNLAPAMRA